MDREWKHQNKIICLSLLTLYFVESVFNVTTDQASWLSYSWHKLCFAVPNLYPCGRHGCSWLSMVVHRVDELEQEMFSHKTEDCISFTWPLWRITKWVHVCPYTKTGNRSTCVFRWQPGVSFRLPDRCHWGSNVLSGCLILVYQHMSLALIWKSSMEFWLKQGRVIMLVNV